MERKPGCARGRGAALLDLSVRRPLGAFDAVSAAAPLHAASATRRTAQPSLRLSISPSLHKHMHMAHAHATTTPRLAPATSS